MYYVSHANYVVIIRLIMMIINIKLFGFHGSFIEYVHCYFIFNMCGKHIARTSLSLIRMIFKCLKMEQTNNLI